MAESLNGRKNGIHEHVALVQRAGDAVREALRRHMLLGESVAVADESGNGNGNGVKILGPDEIRKVLEAWDDGGAAGR